ncbi:Na+/H+ antiporter NhaA [Streptoalloteichus hindustanus]|uniref:Na(+)/H(+) antiporter NhaA n=1 Tax=Streptoalloteichus hindustanus TaxID=2017 RepID=A0A1M5IF91_STRHI|nr:Na+/H+ antiporter NhaA [Streptoalloteichus hindustanus]SHG26917.1 sodium/proton antiporter, NhaA family [Streptoalloteichus hindustanus]
MMALRDRPTTTVSELARYLRTETVGGLVLLTATALALLWANSPWRDSYQALFSFEVGPHLAHLHLSVASWIEDGLLAVFFFVAGLELKRELVAGELAGPRTAALPVIAAVGGMVAPALLALAVSAGTPGAERAWAVPVATDIAFALAVLAITGASMPRSARVFLLSLAVVDDLGAIIVIAAVFTQGLNLVALLVAAALSGLYGFLQHRRVTTPLVYVPLAAATWTAVHASGIHATIAGVVLAMLTRGRPDPGEAHAPAVRMRHLLQPWSAGLAVPLFALSAAGVPVGGPALRELLTDQVAIAVVVGLLLGKLTGILGSSYLAVRLGFAVRPDGLAWRDLGAVALLGGVGFTISLLIAELSLVGAAEERAKAAVLVASATAALLASAAMMCRSRHHRRTKHPNPG